MVFWKSKAEVTHAQVLIYLHQLISGLWCKPISIQHLMESLSVRLASRNVCHYYRARHQNFANKSSRINGVNSIDNDLKWNIQYRKRLISCLQEIKISERQLPYSPQSEFRQCYSKTSKVFIVIVKLCHNKSCPTFLPGGQMT